jgi:hypothetical protein
MDLTLIVSLIALGLAILSILVLLKVFFANRLLSKNIDEQTILVSSLKQNVSGFVNELEEVRSATYAMVNRIKQLETQVVQVGGLIEQVKNSQQNITEQDPQSRFYSKGVKLVSQGASIEELMQECEIPLAEAELLFNLHNKQN